MTDTDIMVDVDSSELESQFEYCVDFIHQHKQAWQLPTQAEQLQIYGLFQQIVSGNIDTQIPTPNKDTPEYAIYNAHAQHTDKSAQQCMREYIELIKTIALRYDRQKHKDNTSESDMIQLYDNLHLTYPTRHTHTHNHTQKHTEKPSDNANDTNTPSHTTNNTHQHTNGHKRDLSAEHTANTEKLDELNEKMHVFDTNGITAKTDELHRHTLESQQTLNNLTEQTYQHNNTVNEKSKHVSNKLDHIEQMHKQLVEKFTENNITDQSLDDNANHHRSTVDTVTDVLSIGIPLVLGAYALYTTYSNRTAVKRR